MLLRAEKLLLFLKLIHLDNDKIFPRWIYKLERISSSNDTSAKI